MLRSPRSLSALQLLLRSPTPSSKWLLRHSEQWFSQCGPQISRNSTPCKLLRKVNFRALPRIYPVGNSGGGPAICVFTSSLSDSKRTRTSQCLSLRNVWLGLRRALTFPYEVLKNKFCIYLDAHLGCKNKNNRMHFIFISIHC